MLTLQLLQLGLSPTGARPQAADPASPYRQPTGWLAPLQNRWVKKREWAEDARGHGPELQPPSSRTRRKPNDKITKYCTVRPGRLFQNLLIEIGPDCNYVSMAMKHHGVLHASGAAPRTQNWPIRKIFNILTNLVLSESLFQTKLGRASCLPQQSAGALT